ncbi:MAG: serine hydrolase [Flavobacteriaceae bacterium]|nr:serine hydrolase [Flavobacteriaceae bacterium]|tara:strand:+ start:381 stop:1517 length:1137 start_codon:yes stop_codon:yes gene_type:complete
MKKVFKALFFLIMTVYGILYISGYSWFIDGVVKIYFTGHTTNYLSDYKVFDNNLIQASKTPIKWDLHEKYNKISPSKILEDYNKKNKTVAYLIIKNDSILFERYYDNYNLNSKSNSNSIAKSFVSALLNKAVQDGYVKSIKQPVSDFFPSLKGPFSRQVTLEDLTSMSSGLDWQEEYYSPFSVTASAYFIDNISSIMLNQKVIEEPGKKYKYLSGATQLLGMVIIKATGKSLSDYLHESIWNPIGMEQDALWQIDSKSNGIEKAFCCIASNARDFAKFGKLYKDFGKWNNKIIIDSSYVVKSITPRFKESPEYGYGFWLGKWNEDKVFWMQGHLGQYVFIIPKKNVIVVRLGHLMGDGDGNDYYTYINEAFEVLKKIY